MTSKTKTEKQAGAVLLKWRDEKERSKVPKLSGVEERNRNRRLDSGVQRD